MTRKKNKKIVRKPIKIFTLDTETRGLFGQVFRIGIYDGWQTVNSSNFQEIKNVLDEYSKEYECHVYIHNLDFDLAKLAKELIPGADFSDSVFISNNVAIFRTTNIILHDSFKLLPSSLEKLSKDFKLESKAKIDLSQHLINKGYAVDRSGKKTKDIKKMDKRKSLGIYFENVDPEEKELNEYLDNDNISLYEIINQIVEISGVDLEDFVACPTTASLAMRVFKINYADDYEDITKTNWRGEWKEFCEEFIRQGYYGGRTEVFKPILTDGYHYDVNSLYPYVMRDNEFPIGYFKFYEGRKAEWAYRYWCNTGEGAGFAEVDIYIPEDTYIPPLPVKFKNKLLFPVGKLSGVWTFHEIANAVKYGGVIKNIKQAIYFKKTAPVFQAFIQDHEILKITSSGAKKQFAKLMQNSLYGKFGMNRIRRTFLGMDKKEECEKNLEEQGLQWFTHKHPLLKQDFIMAEVKSNAQYIQPHIAAYVTSLARLVLYEALVTQEGVSYCDTDSIACKNEMSPEKVDPDAYGKWDLENIVLEGIYIQPKLYAEKHPDNKYTYRAKGIPGEVLSKFNWDTYLKINDAISSGAERIEIFGDHDNKKNIVPHDLDKNGNPIPILSRRKAGSMLKDGIDMSAINEATEKEKFTSQVIRKGINLRNMQKRIFSGNDSKPHTLNMWGDE